MLIRVQIFESWSHQLNPSLTCGACSFLFPTKRTVKYHAFLPTFENKLPIDTLILASKTLVRAPQSLGGYHIGVGRLEKRHEPTDFARIPKINLLEVLLGCLLLK